MEVVRRGKGNVVCFFKSCPNRKNLKKCASREWQNTDAEKRAKEIRPFLNIGDSFKKIVVTGNNTPVWRDEQGILTINILDFLLNPDSLDM